MQSRHVLTILATKNLRGLEWFYRRSFSWVPVVSTESYVEFELPAGQRIGLYDSEGFVRNFGGEPLPEITGPRPFELYLEVTDLAIATERLTENGAQLLSPAARRDWGDEVAYFADPDGNVLALAAVKGVQKPVGQYTRDEFVRRVADVIRRSGVADADTLVVDLENAVHFPMLPRCGRESSIYGSRCVLLPGHTDACQDSHRNRWTVSGSSPSSDE